MAELIAGRDEFAREHTRAGQQQLVRQFTQGQSPDTHFVTYDYDITFDGTTITYTDELGRVWKSYYDSHERLIKVEDPDPDGGGPAGIPTTEYRYDAAGNLRVMIDAEQKTTTYDYDARNRLIAMTEPDPDGPGMGDAAPVTEYKYDGTGNLIAIIDPLRRMTVMQYDAADRLISMIEPDVDGSVSATWQNPVNRFDVNADGTVDERDENAITDSGLWGPLSPLALDELPEVPGLPGLYYVDVDGDGNVDQDDTNLVVSYNPNDPTNQPNYGDLLGRPVSRYAYDPAGNVRFMVDANGNQTDYEYDIRSLNTKVIQPLVWNPLSGVDERPATVFAYDDAGQRVGMTDPLGRQTEYEYDDAGRLIAVLSPDPDGTSHLWRNEVSPMDVDEDGDVDQTDKSLVEAVYQAPPQNHSLSGYFQSWPPANVPGLGYELNSVGPLEDQFKVDVNGDGYVGQVDVDLIHDFVNDGVIEDESLLSSIRTTRFHYDAAGNLRFVVDPMLSVTEYKYNSRNWLEYEIKEKPSGAKSAVGQGVDLSNLAAVKLERPVTQYFYTEVGMLERIVDPNDNQTDWDYDFLDRVKTESRTVGTTPYTRKYTYDQVGNRLTEVDREGRMIVYEYDDLYRNTYEYWFADENASTPDHTITFTYDLADYLSSSEDSFHDYQYMRDGLNRVDTLTQIITGLVVSGGSPTPITLDFDYDLWGNRTRLTAEVGSQDDFETTVEYDALHRAATVTQSSVAGGSVVSPKHVTLDYQLDGLLNSVYRYAGTSSQLSPAIANTQFQYDEAGRLDEINHYRGLDTTSLLHITGYDLAWDLADRPTKFEFTHALFANHSVDSYSYDWNGQLTSAAGRTAPFDESYSYDQNGNRTNSHRSTSYTQAEGFNLLTEDDTYHYKYDAEGNRTERGVLSSWDPTGGLYRDRQEFSWDHRNRLTEVKEYENDVLLKTVSYAYDAFNQLIRRTVDEGSDTSDRFFILDRVPEMPTDGAVANGGTGIWEQIAFSSAQADHVLAEAVARPDDLGQILLQFDGDGSGTVTMTHRYLWGPGVDFQLADELLPASNGNGDTRVLMPLVDHLGTVRDLVEYVEYVPGVPDTILQKHREYDSFGNILGEFNRGDLDGDGQFTVADVDALLTAIEFQQFGEYDGEDVNGDGVLDQSDVEAFVVLVVGSVMGDANWDGMTDGTDWGIWNVNKFMTGNFGWGGADFNGDGSVDGTDWGIWNANKFTGDGNLNHKVLEHIFAYTGRLLDDATGLQNNLHRWYDPNVGRWISEDPIGFKAGDANLYRYISNQIVDSNDPTGLQGLDLDFLDEVILGRDLDGDGYIGPKPVDEDPMPIPFPPLFDLDGDGKVDDFADDDPIRDLLPPWLRNSPFFEDTPLPENPIFCPPGSTYRLKPDIGGSLRDPEFEFKIEITF